MSGPAVVSCNSPTQLIVYASREFCELTGYTQGEVLGRNCRFLQGAATTPESVCVCFFCIWIVFWLLRLAPRESAAGPFTLLFSELYLTF